MHCYARLFSLGKCMLLTWRDGWAVIFGVCFFVCMRVCMSLGLKGAVTRGVSSSKRLDLTQTGSWHFGSPWIADLSPHTTSLSLSAITAYTATRIIPLSVQQWNVPFLHVRNSCSFIFSRVSLKRLAHQSTDLARMQLPKACLASS